MIWLQCIYPLERVYKHHYFLCAEIMPSCGAAGAVLHSSCFVHRNENKPLWPRMAIAQIGEASKRSAQDICRSTSSKYLRWQLAGVFFNIQFILYFWCRVHFHLVFWFRMGHIHNTKYLKSIFNVVYPKCYGAGSIIKPVCRTALDQSRPLIPDCCSWGCWRPETDAWDSLKGQVWRPCQVSAQLKSSL